MTVHWFNRLIITLTKHPKKTLVILLVLTLVFGGLEIVIPLKRIVGRTEANIDKIIFTGLMLISIVFGFAYLIINNLRKITGDLNLKNEQLKNSEAKFRLILETTPTAVISINSVGLIQAYNPAAERIFGYCENEVINRKINMLMPTEYAKFHDEYIKSYIQTGLKKVIGLNREVEALHKDGHVFPIHIAIGEIRIKNEIMFTGIINDLTNIKEVHQELINTKNYVSSIMNSMTDLLFVINPKGKIETVNRRVYELLDYTDQELFSLNMNDLINDHKKIHNYQNLLMDIENEKYIDYSTQIRTKKNKLIPVLITGSILKDQNNLDIGIILAVKDAGDSKLLKELQETQMQLIQSGKLAALGELSSGMAHELNNPLHFIKGFNNLIKANLSKGDIENIDINQTMNFILDIDKNCDRIKKIIDHFREFAGQAELYLKNESINEIIEKSFILFNDQLKLENIKIVKDFCLEDLKVFVDGSRIEQAIVNLIKNSRDAIKQAHGNNGGTIILKTFKNENSVCIEIIDDGIGIPKHQLDKIFNPFFTTKETGQGSGLGLSVCHSLIKDHKGEIKCRSIYGKGTTLTIILPISNMKEETLRAG